MLWLEELLINFVVRCGIKSKFLMKWQHMPLDGPILFTLNKFVENMWTGVFILSQQVVKACSFNMISLNLSQKRLENVKHKVLNTHL